ncbi:MAG: ribonuclease III [Kaiparowitsia implicata GSE-PSE-MK54-09C]|jgi:ribonuclease-3 family protein|nr:ribonuclease III [Kaiparowitsia implicata GSE-PSE-MK54-09C]
MSNGLEGNGAKFSDAELQRFSPAALAYLGDAVYELHIRTCCLLPPRRIRAYHDQVVSQVRAEQQSHYLQQLIPHLTPDELEWVKRGRNSSSRHPRRLDLATYQAATSLEALLGYLYLQHPARLTEVLALLTPLVTAPTGPPVL